MAYHEKRIAGCPFSIRPLKRLLMHVAACNLGLWMRTVTGNGTPRGLQGQLAAALAIYFSLWALPRDRLTPRDRPGLELTPFAIPSHRLPAVPCTM